MRFPGTCCHPHRWGLDGRDLGALRVGQGERGPRAELAARRSHQGRQGDVEPEHAHRGRIARGSCQWRSHPHDGRPIGPRRRIAEDDVARPRGARRLEQRVSADLAGAARDLAADLAEEDGSARRDDLEIQHAIGRVGSNGIECRPRLGQCVLVAAGNPGDGARRGRPGQGRLEGIERGRDRACSRRGVALDAGLLRVALAVDGGRQEGRADGQRQDRHRQEGKGEPQPDKPNRAGSDLVFCRDGVGQGSRVDRGFPWGESLASVIPLHARGRCHPMVRVGPTARTARAAIRGRWPASY